MMLHASPLTDWRRKFAWTPKKIAPNGWIWLAPYECRLLVGHSAVDVYEQRAIGADVSVEAIY